MKRKVSHHRTPGYYFDNQLKHNKGRENCGFLCCSFFSFTVHFVMKCDDDSFVNVPNLIHFLLGGTIPVYSATLHHYNEQTVRTRLPINRLKYHTDILVGSLFCHVKPISNYRSKWWVNEKCKQKKNDKSSFRIVETLIILTLINKQIIGKTINRK